MQDSLSVDWSFFFLRWKRIAAGIAAGFIIAGLIFALSHPLWESSVLIQLGHSGAAEPGGSAMLETTDSTAMNMMRPTFIEAAMQRAGRPDMLKELLPRIYHGHAHMGMRVINPDILVVTVQASTPDLAKQLLDGIVTEITEEHKQLMTPRMQGETDARPTQTVGGIEVSASPVFPQPRQFMAIGLMLGVGFAALLLWGAKKD